MTDTAVKTNETPLILAVETSGRMGSIALATGPQLLGMQSFTGQTCLGAGANTAKQVTEPLVTAKRAEAGPSRSQMRHSAELFPAVTILLDRFGKKPKQIEHVYISVGPGSFTGLRIAVTFAKTMALANQAKIVPVDTLDCIAANVINFTAEHPASPEGYEGQATETAENKLKSNERLAVILDAKRSQFFIAVYENTRGKPRVTSDTIWQKILPDCLMTAEEFLDRFAGCGRPIALIGEGLVYYRDKFSDPAVRFLDEKYWNPHAEKVHELGWPMAQKTQFANPIVLTPKYLRQPDAKLKNA